MSRHQRASGPALRARSGERNLLEGELDVAPGASMDVDDSRLRRIAYARLVRKGEGVQTMAHGPEAAYAFRTALGNANGLCHGAFAGYVVHFEHLSLGARLAACHAGFATDVVRASSNELGGELRIAHTWDLPHVGIDAGLAAGGSAA